MGFAENLKAIMKEKGKTASDIAKILGITRGTVTHWSNGIRFPSDDVKLRDLASVLGVTEQELINPNNSNTDNKKIISIPVIEALAGCGSAGMLEQLRLSDDRMQIDRRMFPNDIISDKLSMIRIVGDSMQPYLDENDWAMIQMRNGYDVVPVNAIYLVAHGDNVQIKRCAFQPDGSCLLISDNHCYPPEKALAGDWDIVGKVVARLKVGSPMLIKE